MFNKRLEEFGAANQHVSSINLENGVEIKADLVLVSIGAAPNITLAQDAGLVCDNGICVDQDMRTSDPRFSRSVIARAVTTRSCRESRALKLSTTHPPRHKSQQLLSAIKHAQLPYHHDFGPTSKA
nr:FAD-dependent oxidoreductase [Frigidibacter mobilis]